FLSRYTHGTHRALHSFPTRRSSDLEDQLVVLGRAISADTRRENLNKPPALGGMLVDGLLIAVFPGLPDLHDPFPEAYKLVFVMLDRKSTRLNSSHVKISYAVFCLKK